LTLTDPEFAYYIPARLSKLEVTMIQPGMRLYRARFGPDRRRTWTHGGVAGPGQGHQSKSV